MRLLLSMVESAAFCELARRARDADYRRLHTDARLRSQPAEFRRAYRRWIKRHSGAGVCNHGAARLVRGPAVIIFTSSKNIHTQIHSFFICGKPAAIRRAASVSEHLRIICGNLRPEPYGRAQTPAPQLQQPRRLPATFIPSAAL